MTSLTVRARCVELDVLQTCHCLQASTVDLMALGSEHSTLLGKKSLNTVSNSQFLGKALQTLDQALHLMVSRAMDRFQAVIMPLVVVSTLLMRALVVPKLLRRFKKWKLLLTKTKESVYGTRHTIGTGTCFLVAGAL